MLRKLLDVLESIDHVFGQHAFAHAGHIQLNRLRGSRKVVSLLLNLFQVDACRGMCGRWVVRLICS